MFYPLYQIITYNRRVIAGCKACCGFDCAPDLNRFYRTVYLMLAGGFVGLIVASLLVSGTTASEIASTILAGLAIVGLIVGVVIRVGGSANATWSYAGNYVTCLVVVAGAMLPLTIWPELSDKIAWLNVSVAVLLGFSEFRRRSL